MGRVLLCAALLALCVLGVSTEAARHHENFSQGTYYDQTQQESERPARVETKEKESVEGETTTETTIDTTDKPQPAPVDTTIPDRYPHGYPGQEQYNAELKSEDTDPEAKYSAYKGTYNAQYNSLNTDTTDENTQTVPDRYPHGYPGSDNPFYSGEVDPEAKFHQGKYQGFSSQVDSSDENAVIPNRYPHGYYGNADIEAETQGEADVYTSHKSSHHVSFSTDVDHSNGNNPDGVVHERYPRGYYPGLNTDGYADTYQQNKGNSFQQNAFQQNQASYQQYPSNEPRYGYEGIQGDFSSQLQGHEIPFELTGGACPTQYWVSNPQKWPKFFNINSKVTDAFGEKAGKVYGETSILDALTDTRADPYSKLVNTGMTAVLNSYSRAQYKLKHPAVIESFLTALASPEAAAKQALVFEEANVSVFSAGISGSCT